jgi:hypothetical protein
VIHWVLFYKGYYQSSDSLFFLSSETIIAIIIKFTYIMGTCSTKLRLTFHKVLFINKTIFSPLCEILYLLRHYSPMASLMILLHRSLSFAFSQHALISKVLISFNTESSHLNLSLPTTLWLGEGYLPARYIILAICPNRGIF